MDFWQIIFSLVTAAFLIFLRNAHLKAQKQKIIANRLHSYLMYWKGFVLDNNLFSIFHMGIEWNEEIDEIIKNGLGAESLVKLKEDKEKELEELKKEIIEGSANINKEDIEKALKKIPSNSVDYILQYSQKAEQNLVEGKTFISDEDASYLGVYVAQTSVELKMHLISMINSGVGILVMLISNPKEFDSKDYADDIVKLVWKGIVISKHIDSLSKTTDYFNKLNTFDLTIKNLKDEF